MVMNDKAKLLIVIGCCDVSVARFCSETVSAFMRFSFCVAFV
jgi:hypothetical protein